tara:strand:- start:501 stop:1043 length:543 start_codon:yes stop_codon:yes gene_type:complete
MADDLGSTNITDLVNEEDTDINDDMVEKILHELDNGEPAENIQEDNINDFENMNDFSNMDYSPNNIQLNDRTFNHPNFTNQNSINSADLEESTNTKNVNSILNDSGEDLFCFNNILNQCKLPILVFIIVLLFNNPIVTDILSDTISNLIKNKTINNYISLFIRATISAILAYIIKYFDLI